MSDFAIILVSVMISVFVVMMIVLVFGLAKTSNSSEIPLLSEKKVRHNGYSWQDDEPTH